MLGCVSIREVNGMALFQGTNRIQTKQKALSKKELQEVQKLAYQLFVDRGYEHGHDKEDWAKAEQSVRNRLD